MIRCTLSKCLNIKAGASCRRPRWLLSLLVDGAVDVPDLCLFLEGDAQRAPPPAPRPCPAAWLRGLMVLGFSLWVPCGVFGGTSSSQDSLLWTPHRRSWTSGGFALGLSRSPGQPSPPAAVSGLSRHQEQSIPVACTGAELFALDKTRAPRPFLPG